MRFIAIDSAGASHEFSSDGSVLWDGSSTQDSIAWRAEAHAAGIPLSLSLEGEMHADGSLMFSLNITNNGAAIALENVLMAIPFREDASRYSMGLGKTGGLRPPQWQWRWVSADTVSIWVC